MEKQYMFIFVRHAEDRLIPAIDRVLLQLNAGLLLIDGEDNVSKIKVLDNSRLIEAIIFAQGFGFCAKVRFFPKIEARMEIRKKIPDLLDEEDYDGWINLDKRELKECLKNSKKPVIELLYPNHIYESESILDKACDALKEEDIVKDLVKIIQPILGNKPNLKTKILTFFLKSRDKTEIIKAAFKYVEERKKIFGTQTIEHIKDKIKNAAKSFIGVNHREIIKDGITD